MVLGRAGTANQLGLWVKDLSAWRKLLLTL